jgi:hypothetical protein
LSEIMLTSGFVPHVTTKAASGMPSFPVIRKKMLWFLLPAIINQPFALRFANRDPREYCWISLCDHLAWNGFKLRERVNCCHAKNCVSRNLTWK